MKFSPLYPQLFATEDGDILLYGITKLKPSVGSGGYMRIRYMRNGTLSACLAHRVVASAWCDGYSQELAVNHKDGNKLNNEASNLEWVTWAENTRHAYANGLNKQAGENHSRVKLSAKDVLTIRQLLLVKVPTMEIAKRFNIGQRQIYYIKHGKSWAQQ